VGTFGAAAACAHALRLDSEQWLHAFGIAGTTAAGLKSMFGTMCKPLHAGRAASNGLAAAKLAARGFSSNPAVLETDQGFGTTQTSTFSPEEALKDLGEKFHIRSVLFKYHAACYLTHSSIEALLRLKEKHGLTPDRVESVTLRVPPIHLSVCNIQEPQTPLEGKFSLRFTAALALAGDDTSERAFSHESVRDPALVAMRDRVNVEPVEHLPSNHSSEVIVALEDGTTLEDSVNMEIPEANLERQWERLVGKFRALATPVIGEGRTEELSRSVTSLEETPNVAEVATLCTRPNGKDT
jgi:2-methylcitrate dehydratase PrpD